MIFTDTYRPDESLSQSKYRVTANAWKKNLIRSGQTAMISPAGYVRI